MPWEVNMYKKGEVTVRHMTAEVIVEAARLADGTLTKGEISDLLGVPRGSVYYIYNKLRKHGIDCQFKSSGHGRNPEWAKALNMLTVSASTGDGS
jgi:transposase